MRVRHGLFVALVFTSLNCAHFFSVPRCPASNDVACLAAASADADLRELNLNPSRVALLKSSSRGLVHFKDFVTQLPLNPPQLYFGIYRIRALFEQEIRPFGLYLPDPKTFDANAVRSSLKTILGQGVSAVFFVPPNVLFRDEGFPVTSQEMWEFLDDPALRKNVLFVYGAYEPHPTKAREIQHKPPLAPPKK